MRPAIGANLLHNLPLRFETTSGAKGADALARGRGYSLVLNAASATLALEGRRDRRVRMTLAGGRPDSIATPLGPQPAVTNYLLGTDPLKWRTGVRGYSSVKYDDVYPGVDLIFYGIEGQHLEYDFVVAPGAEPSKIALQFDGADDVRVDASGDLL